MASTKLIIGCGYLGHRVSELWLSAGDRVLGVTRSGIRADAFRRQRIEPIVADVTDPRSLGAMPIADAVLFAVGYDRSAKADIHAVYAGGVRHVLDALPSSACRFVSISTTGVYGLHASEWVDERTPPDPQRDGGWASLAVEAVLAAHPLGRRSVILRMGGLYGPGRVPHLDKLRAGQPLPVPRDGWLNLIHVDDAARIVVAADAWLAAHGDPDGPHVFCVTDGAPVRRDEYYREAARLLGAPPPQFAPPPPDSPAAARAGANRRVRNDKMRAAFIVELVYPTYREALAAILPSC